MLDKQRFLAEFQALTLVLSGLCLFGCSRSDKEIVGPVETSSVQRLTSKQIEKIEAFCSDCHPMPNPANFPKSSWAEEVAQGYAFYIDSMRTDLEEPVRQDTIRYFRDAAPDKVIVERADQMEVEPAPVEFIPGHWMGSGAESPVTAHLVWNDKSNSVLFTDMKGGSLREWVLPDKSAWQLTSPTGTDLGLERTIAEGRNTCRVTLCDWNEDGIQDYLIGELGSFPVGDHEDGRVSLLLGNTSGDVTQQVLAEKLGRVVEAKPIDFDEDGDLDVLVAEFGWRRTGGLKLLRNVGGSPEAPEMLVETIDARHGALGVEIADLNEDGKADFVVAYGQEFETIEVYLSLGGGEYENREIFALPDPSYNSSAFSLVDMDQDGRLDILHTCGDTMDAILPKPYHGVRVVRNLGDGNWENKELGLLVGALQASAADFDGDGDLDLVAVGLFPDAPADGPGAYDSICWWEQKSGFEFIRHSIERDHCRHAACATGDVDGDGRIDILVGEWMVEGQDAAFRVFLNRPTNVSPAN